MNKAISPTIHPQINWDEIDTVLLDMDGTLLDKYFDDYFWEKYVPEMYADKHKLSTEDAETKLLEKYRSVESTLQWTDLNYWTTRLGLDVAALKKEIDHLINVHDHVFDFLTFVASRKIRLCLITNAHPKTLEIKLAKTHIDPFFDDIICADEIGAAKEQIEFWHGLEKALDFDRNRSLFADDTEKCLFAARMYGIECLLHIAKPSSKLEVHYSTEFPSIADFGELNFP